MNEALKIQRLKSRTDERIATIGLIKELAKNPVVEIIAAYTIIEFLQGQKLIGNISGTIAETGCLAAVGAQQIAPLMPYLAQGTESISKSIPALLALGSGG